MHTSLSFICILQWTSSTKYFMRRYLEFDEFTHSGIRHCNWDAQKERRTKSAAEDRIR